MANDVFANGREISCKRADGKTICELPDVCFTPPQSPATPPGVPIPYPNTATASDTTDGSRTVLISGQEAMLKNKSYFKKSIGDEAGCAPKKGMLTSKIQGKAYFISWSMNVKFEGENVVRHMDQTTNNHASPAANGSTPMIYQDGECNETSGSPVECREAEKQQRAAQRARSPTMKRKGVTAGAFFTPGNQTFKAASNVSESTVYNAPVKYAGFSTGVPPVHAKPPGKSNVTCSGKRHRYKSCGSSPTGDAEAKIIEDLFSRFKENPPRGTLYLKVVGAPVCCDCQKLMRCASKSIDIVICPPARKEEPCKE